MKTELAKATLRNLRDLGWLEGIIDGEGSISFTKSRACGTTTYRGFAWQARLAIGSTTEPIVLRARKIVGEGSVGKSQHRTQFSTKPQYRFLLANGGIRRLFPKLRLTIKDDHRKLVLEAVRLLSEHRQNHTPHDARLEEIYQEMKRLNGG